MEYHLRCDSCGLDRTTEDRVAAHELARDHEADYPTHHVSLRRVQ